MLTFIIIHHSKLMLSLPKQKIIIILLIYISLSFVQGYKEFFLTRSSIQNQQFNCSSQSFSSNTTYRELCYLKDITYHMDLFIDGLIYYVAVDLTTPLSWLKSPDCHSGGKECRIIQNSEKAQAEAEFKDVRIRFRLFGKQRQNTHRRDVAITGSSDFISGQIQSIEYAEFYAKDSKSARQLTRLISLSLFLAPQRDTIAIRNANIVKVQKLSENVDALIDGAISLRSSLQPSSFLSEIFANSQSGKRIVTIFLHPLSKQGTISIGDLSLKNAKSKQSEIIWVGMKDNHNESVSCFSTGISIKQIFDQNAHENVLNSAKDIYFTTSTSYIYLPQDHITWLTSTLKEKTEASCRIKHDSGIYRCEWGNLQRKRQGILLVLTFKLMQKAKISIPFTTLILISEDLFIQFAIRSSPSGNIILGEPFFEQYVTFIDYSTNKLGFSPSYFHHSDKFTTILVYFLRMILFGAITLFITYICYNPCQQFRRFIKRKTYKWKQMMNPRRSGSYDGLEQIQSPR